MGIGKYFHKDKSESPKQSKSRSRATSAGANGSGLQTSRYEAMPPAGLPQTGTYPLKGNNSTAAVAGQNPAFRTSTDHRPNQSTRPETAPSHRTTTTTTTTTSMAPRLEIPKSTNNFHFFDQNQQGNPDRGFGVDNRTMQQDTGLDYDFSAMNLGNDASGATPPISYYPGSASGSSRIDPRVDAPSRNEPGIRMVNQADQRQTSPYYGKQGPSPKQQDSAFYSNRSTNSQQQISPSYNNRSADKGYGQTPGGPISNTRSNADLNQGYSHAPSNSIGNPLPSTDYNQDYSQASRSPIANSHAGEDIGHGYGQSSRSPVTSGGFRDVDQVKAAKRASIPRKQVGTVGHTPSSSNTSPSPISANYATQISNQPPPPVPKHDSYPEQSRYQDSRYVPQQSKPTQASKYHEPRAKARYDNSDEQQQYQDPSAIPQGLNIGGGSTSQRDGYSPSGVPPLFPRAQPASGGVGAKIAAKELVQRAKTNSKDTEVIERIAPAVVHEKVIKKVHHKREEVITRDIHTHDVYHRILPIIDVEVLPPRHFLPVEGGGLVEIGADEVPGRAKNWVIAETASKIPSDQPAPRGVSRFTAREFPGREGDTVEYTTPQGIKRTEETWVHPPELETGGKETGQTWPMVFGKEGTDGQIRTHGHSSSRDRKRRDKKRTSTSAAQTAASGQHAAA